MYRVRREARFSLLAICNHWRSGGFEFRDRVADAVVEDRIEISRRDMARRQIVHSLDQSQWSGNASNRLSRNRHARFLSEVSISTTRRSIDLVRGARLRWPVHESRLRL